jgi:predicted metal-dependent enzyme (double-stranded beta helix superfamily)
MEQAIEATAYGMEDYIADLRAITAASADPQRIIEQVRPLAQRVALDRSWLKPEHYRCDEEQGVGLTLLHEEPDHTLAVFAVAWLPGRGVPPHDHGTWAVVAGVDGPETNAFWKRVDDGSRPGHAEIVKTSEKVFREGDVLSMLPGAIHNVTNNTDQVTVSLHCYGLHLNHAQRSQFDPRNNREEPFILKVK